MYVVAGTFILFFGWFEFNAGSTLAATDLRISVIAINTFLAGATGAVVALYLSLARAGQAEVVQACNGSLAGLVGITAPCAFVAPWAAVVIGAIAPLVMDWANAFVERRLKVDDPVGAVGVHGGRAHSLTVVARTRGTAATRSTPSRSWLGGPGARLGP